MFWLTGIVLVCFCRGECRWCLFTSWNLYVLTWLVCVYICLFFFLLSFCKAAFVLFSFVTIWLTIVLVTWLLISSISFVIRILFSVILFLFFVVRSRIKVLSSSILLFVVCRSFRRFVFYSAIGVIIFLIKSVMFWFPFDFPMVTVGVVSFLGFLDGLLFLLSLLMSNSFRWFLLWCEFYYFYHFYFGAILGRHLISCMFHVEGVLHICTIWWP